MSNQNSRTLDTLKLVSLISAAHLAFELFAREQAPFPPVGNLVMAMASGYAFLQAEIVSVTNLATGRNWLQRGLGFLTYAAMMAANGFVQTAYYARSDTALLHQALGWWIVGVAVGVALQLAAELWGQQQQEAKAEAETLRKEEEEKAEAERKEKRAKAEAETLRKEKRDEDRERWELEQAALDREVERQAKIERLRLNAEITKAKHASEAPPQKHKSAAKSAAKSGKEIAFELLASDPDIGNSELAERAGVSDSAARSYRSQWKAFKPELASANGHAKEAM